jgi:hypothetical protein
MSFTIKPDTRVLFRMCWSWKYGSLAELPTDWTEDQMRQFICSYDEECRLKMEREDALNAALARAHEPPEPPPIPAGLPSLGGLILGAKFNEDPVLAIETEESQERPSAASRLAGARGKS